MRLIPALALCALSMPALAQQADSPNAKFANAYVQSLKQQRNEAADQAAVLSGRLAVLGEELAAARVDAQKAKRQCEVKPGPNPLTPPPVPAPTPTPTQPPAP